MPPTSLRSFCDVKMVDAASNTDDSFEDKETQTPTKETNFPVKV
jgi:hypothetical protein